MRDSDTAEGFSSSRCSQRINTTDMKLPPPSSRHVSEVTDEAEQDLTQIALAASRRGEWKCP